MSSTVSHKAVRLPKKLADSFDTYFQTSRYAQKNFTKFDKSLVLTTIKNAADRHGYVLDEEHALSSKFKGVFKISGGKGKTPKTLRVSAATLPQAEDWS